MVRQELFCRWLAVDATSSVPRVRVIQVARTVHPILAAILLTLAQVLDTAEVVAGDGLVVLERFLDNHSLGKRFLGPLNLQRLLRTVQHLLLGVAENLLLLVELPVVVAGPLLARRIVTVSLAVHGVSLYIFLCHGTASRIHHLLSALEALGRLAEVGITALSSFGPIITSRVSLAQRLALLGRILAFTDVVEFVAQAAQALSFHKQVNLLTNVCWLAVTVGSLVLDGIVSMAPVLLNCAWCVHVTLSELLQVLGRGRRLGLIVQLLSDAEIDVLAVSNAHDCVARRPNLRNRISANPNCCLERFAEQNCLSIVDFCHIYFAN